MVTKSQIVEKAHEYIGTPFRHQGRIKGVGIDCAGLAIELAKELGLPWVDRRGYDRTGTGTENMRILIETILLKTSKPEPGDLVLFHYFNKKIAQHLGIWTSATQFIHAYASAKKVIKITVNDKWQKRILGSYSFPGVK